MEAMANPQAVAYLRENREKFPPGTLREQLLHAGYPQAVIDAALAEVFGSPAAAGARPGFFNFRAPRTYRSFGEKIPDFLLGFFGVLIVNVALSFFFGGASRIFGLYRFGYGLIFGPLLGLVFLVGEIALIFFFWKRRRWLAYGVLATWILAAIFVALGILAFFFIARSF